MAFSIFIDALPYNEMKQNYNDWFQKIQISELVPNIGYSSSLHWQLYCNKYPDERGVFVDWAKEAEPKKSIVILSKILAPFENILGFGFLSRKVFNRLIFRRNVFANIPYRFRPYFSKKGSYLFWDVDEYQKESIFDGYTVVSQDEGHISFADVIRKVNSVIEADERNIFLVLGFADALGHTCKRGSKYDEMLRPYMDVLKTTINKYLSKHPNEEVLIVSDHGMSTVERRVDCGLEAVFGKQGKESYIAYCDSAVMCIWAKNEKLANDIRRYLNTKEYGHVLSNKERQYYHVTNKAFGDLIFILREGNVFANNWFGKSIRRESEDGWGMHGFWPEREAEDQMATIVLINGRRQANSLFDYYSANTFIRDVMKG